MTFQRPRLAAVVASIAVAWGAAGPSAHAQEEIEQGATHPSQVEISAGTRTRTTRARTDAPLADRDRDGIRDRDRDRYGDRDRDGVDDDDDDLRIGLQARIDALNTLAFAAPNVGDLANTTITQHLFVPIVAPGVRIVDGRLFLGLGLGLAGGTTDTGLVSTSRSGFSLTPMGHYDLLIEGPVTFSLGGWLNFARLGETETCNNNNECVNANDDETGWGLSIVSGVHAFLARGLSLGGEFGWGFLSVSSDDDDDRFSHGLFGSIVLEATIGI